MLQPIKINELRTLYRRHIRKDFPVNERPPLWRIKQLFKKKPKAFQTNFHEGFEEGFFFMPQKEWDVEQNNRLHDEHKHCRQQNGILDLKLGCEQLGYSINAISNDAILIVLFAMNENVRGQGFGTAFLTEMIAHYQTLNVHTIILEVERPEDAKSETERMIREKRIAFYERVGFVLRSDITFKTFTVPMYLMVYQTEQKTKDECFSKEALIVSVKKLYEIMVGKRLMRMLEIS